MPTFPKPDFAYSFSLKKEKRAVRCYRNHKPGRQISKRSSGRLRLASWNIANLGAQKRDDDRYALLAEIIRWFDLVAIQEPRDDLSGLDAIMRRLPKSFRRVFAEKAGNEEGMVFLYRSRKIKQLELCGEIAIPVSDHADIHLPGVSRAEHSTRIASSISTDSDYDQILCFPSLLSRVTATGVFDYDGAVFADLFQLRGKGDFNAYLRYYPSDHRPVWRQIRLTS